MPAEIEVAKHTSLSPTEFLESLDWDINKKYQLKTAPSLHDLSSKFFNHTDVLELSDWLTQEQFEVERINKLEHLTHIYNTVFFKSIDVNLVRTELISSLHFFLHSQFKVAVDAVNTDMEVDKATQNILWFYPKAMRELDEVILKHSYQ